MPIVAKKDPSMSSHFAILLACFNVSTELGSVAMK